MQTHSINSTESKNRRTANVSAVKQNKRETVAPDDQRPDAKTRQKTQKAINDSPQVRQLKATQEMVNNSSRAKQIEAYQKMTINGPQSKLTAQLKSSPGDHSNSVSTNAVVQRRIITDVHGKEIDVPDHYVKHKGSEKYEVWGDPEDPGTHWSIAKVKGVQSHFTQSEGKLEAKKNNWQDFQKSLRKGGK